MGKKKKLVITMRDIIAIVAAVIAGVIIGYFGVLGSVSVDIEPSQRINMLGAISLIYFSVGAVLGLLFPHFSWKWGIFLSAPGALYLGSLLLKGFNTYLLLYLGSIIFFACIGAWDGKILRNRRNKRQLSQEQPKKGRSKKEAYDKPKNEQPKNNQTKEKLQKDKPKKKRHSKR